MGPHFIYLNRMSRMNSLELIYSKVFEKLIKKYKFNISKGFDYINLKNEKWLISYYDQNKYSLYKLSDLNDGKYLICDYSDGIIKYIKNFYRKEKLDRILKQN